MEKVDVAPESTESFKDYSAKELIGKKVKFVFGLACSPKAIYEDVITVATRKRIKIAGCETQFDWDGNDVRFVKDKSQSHVSKIILSEE